MKPPFEYRAKAAPQKAAKAVPEPLGPNGRWVWVEDGQMVTKRSKTKSREYMREYMKKYRTKDKAV